MGKPTPPPEGFDSGFDAAGLGGAGLGAGGGAGFGAGGGGGLVGADFGFALCVPKRTVPVLVGAVPGRGPPTKTVPGLMKDATRTESEVSHRQRGKM